MSDPGGEKNEAKKANLAIMKEPMPTRENVAAAIAARLASSAPTVPAPTAPAPVAAEAAVESDTDDVLFAGETPPR